MKTILFQGDSITDVCRVRENHQFPVNLSPGFLAPGYAGVVSANLSAKYKGEYNYINRGISGNRIVDVYARIKSDIINLKPDYMSLYIGVNDVWHEIGSQNGVAPQKFEKIYTMLLEEIYEALPDIKIMLIAPFVLEGTATENTEEVPDRLERFEKGVAINADIVRKIADKFNLPCISLQPIFDDACKYAPISYWTGDGVHPSIAGHGLIAEEWIKVFEEKLR